MLVCGGTNIRSSRIKLSHRPKNEDRYRRTSRFFRKCFFSDLTLFLEKNGKSFRATSMDGFEAEHKQKKKCQKTQN